MFSFPTGGSGNRNNSNSNSNAGRRGQRSLLTPISQSPSLRSPIISHNGIGTASNGIRYRSNDHDHSPITSAPSVSPVNSVDGPSGSNSLPAAIPKPAPPNFYPSFCVACVSMSRPKFSICNNWTYEAHMNGGKHIAAINSSYYNRILFPNPFECRPINQLEAFKANCKEYLQNQQINYNGQNVIQQLQQAQLSGSGYTAVGIDQRDRGYSRNSNSNQLPRAIEDVDDNNSEMEQQDQQYVHQLQDQERSNNGLGSRMVIEHHDQYNSTRYSPQSSDNNYNRRQAQDRSHVYVSSSQYGFQSQTVNSRSNSPFRKLQYPAITDARPNYKPMARSESVVIIKSIMASLPRHVDPLPVVVSSPSLHPAAASAANAITSSNIGSIGIITGLLNNFHNAGSSCWISVVLRNILSIPEIVYIIINYNLAIDTIEPTDISIVEPSLQLEISIMKALFSIINQDRDINTDTDNNHRSIKIDKLLECTELFIGFDIRYRYSQNDSNEFQFRLLDLLYGEIKLLFQYKSFRIRRIIGCNHVINNRQLQLTEDELVVSLENNTCFRVQPLISEMKENLEKLLNKKSTEYDTTEIGTKCTKLDCINSKQLMSVCESRILIKNTLPKFFTVDIETVELIDRNSNNDVSNAVAADVGTSISSLEPQSIKSVHQLFIPMTINLAGVCEDKDINSYRWLPVEIKNIMLNSNLNNLHTQDPEQLLYDLHSITIHTGESMDSGHYFSICRNNLYINQNNNNSNTNGPIDIARAFTTLSSDTMFPFTIYDDLDPSYVFPLRFETVQLICMNANTNPVTIKEYLTENYNIDCQIQFRNKLEEKQIIWASNPKLNLDTAVITSVMYIKGNSYTKIKSNANANTAEANTNGDSNINGSGAAADTCTRPALVTVPVAGDVNVASVAASPAVSPIVAVTNIGTRTISIDRPIASGLVNYAGMSVSMRRVVTDELLSSFMNVTPLYNSQTSMINVLRTNPIEIMDFLKPKVLAEIHDTIFGVISFSRLSKLTDQNIEEIKINLNNGLEKIKKMTEKQVLALFKKEGMIRTQNIDKSETISRTDSELAKTVNIDIDKSLSGTLIAPPIAITAAAATRTNSSRLAALSAAVKISGQLVNDNDKGLGHTIVNGDAYGVDSGDDTDELMDRINTADNARVQEHDEQYKVLECKESLTGSLIDNIIDKAKSIRESNQIITESPLLPQSAATVHASPAANHYPTGHMHGVVTPTKSSTSNVTTPTRSMSLMTLESNRGSGRGTLPAIATTPVNTMSDKLLLIRSSAENEALKHQLETSIASNKSLSSELDKVNKKCKSDELGYRKIQQGFIRRIEDMGKQLKQLNPNYIVTELPWPAPARCLCDQMRVPESSEVSTTCTVVATNPSADTLVGLTLSRSTSTAVPIIRSDSEVSSALSICPGSITSPTAPVAIIPRPSDGVKRTRLSLDRRTEEQKQSANAASKALRNSYTSRPRPAQATDLDVDELISQNPKSKSTVSNANNDLN